MDNETEGEALSEWPDDGSFEPEKHRRRRGSLIRPKTRHLGTHYYPESDAEAIAQIEALGVYRWDTHKVSGRFVHDPYWITAEINGRLHTIHLPGRFGRTLSYLKERIS